ncbi:hypothetical protein VTL71DRAFT_4945 [Oculimacula yallundae]|uniref:CorA-like transporter domain-containing protein n=1 Tax=Oculimacula yallundae TaxID=86028 RepID=A0ABR4C3E2_9HELO
MSQKNLDGWETYPTNLPLSSLDVDGARVNSRIDQFASDLFEDQGVSSLKYLEFQKSDENDMREVGLVPLNAVQDLSAICKISQDSLIFFIEQSFSWSRLQICEEHFRKLFTYLKIHPDFLEVVRLFCQKVRPAEESFNTFFFNLYGSPQLSSHRQSYNIGYNVKYVSRHGRKFPKDPFSLREVGVYQQFSSITQTCDWVILQAPPQLQERLRCAFGISTETVPAQQHQLHPLILLCVSEDWREYLDYLEEEFSLLVDKGFYTNIKGPRFEGDIEADYSDIRKLQILTDKLRRLHHILDLNIRLGYQLRDTFKELPTNFIDKCTDKKMTRFIYDQQTSADRINSLLSRSTGISQLVQILLDTRATEASRKMNLEMQKLTEQGMEENRLIKRLTEKSTWDTKSMMIIASISAVCLPATFLATLFGSNFFVYSQESNELTVASNFWIYIVFAVGISGAVSLSWVLWRKRRGRQLEQDASETLPMNQIV